VKAGLVLAKTLASQEKQYDFWNKLALYYNWVDRFTDSLEAIQTAKALSARIPEYRPDNVLDYEGSYWMRCADGEKFQDGFKPIVESTQIRENFTDEGRDQRVAVLGRYLMGIWYYRATTHDVQKMHPDFPRQARTWLSRGLELARQIEFERGESYIRNYLGNIDILEKKYASALEELHQSMMLALRLSDQRRLARVQESMFHCYRDQGDTSSARQWGREALNKFDFLGMQKDKENIEHELNGLGE
jgi:tetratricopeptide (TPR) repeat protein